jgi:hypothetical protein
MRKQKGYRIRFKAKGATFHSEIGGNKGYAKMLKGEFKEYHPQIETVNLAGSLRRGRKL